MRLIDADALKEKIDNIWDGRPISPLGARILATIDHAPTIDPKAKVIAQVTFDEDKLREIVHEEVERIKEEYDITDGWIPCSERLPDIDTSVIICTASGNITDGYRWNEKDWFLAWSEYNGWHEGNDEGRITAWMPLPKPYKRR